MPQEKLSSPAIAIPEETRSAEEWGEVLVSAPDRVRAINAGRTKAIERAIGAEMKFDPRIAEVSSVDDLPSALTCTISPLEGEISMWPRIAAAVDLAFGARPILDLYLTGRSKSHFILTNEIRTQPSGTPIRADVPVELREVRMDPSERPKKRSEGKVRFECSQGGVSVGIVEVRYRLAPHRDPVQTEDESDDKDSLVIKNKDLPLPLARDSNDLHSVMGMEFGDHENGFDAVYRPRPYCLNYHDTVHGSGLIAFAITGVQGIENGFDVDYKGPAIPEFSNEDPQATSAKAFYRRRVGRRIQIFREDDLIHPVAEVQGRQSPEGLQSYVGAVNSHAHPFLRSASGLGVTVDNGEIVATIGRPSPDLLATYADQVFAYHTGDEFMGMFGPTKNITITLDKKNRLDPEKTLVIHKRGKCTLAKGAKGYSSTVPLEFIQDGKIVATADVECILLDRERREKFLTMGLTPTSAAIVGTRRKTASALESRESNVAGSSATVREMLTVGRGGAELSLDRVLNSELEELMMEEFGSQSRPTSRWIFADEEVANSNGVWHGGITAAFLIREASKQWEEYRINYTRPIDVELPVVSCSSASKTVLFQKQRMRNNETNGWTDTETWVKVASAAKMVH